MPHDTGKSKILVSTLILVSAILFSLLTVYLQVEILGLHYLEEGNQIKRHLAVLNGTAGNPWQYRVLAEYLVEGAIRLFKELDVPHHIAVAFISFRLIQNVLIFLTAYMYYRKFGLSVGQALIGISLLAWGMTHAYYDSDLQFSIYSDVFFYLAAGLCVLSNKSFWVIPITGLAALNRETSGLIPFMLLAVCLPHKIDRLQRNKVLMLSIALALYAIVFIVLRGVYGPQNLLIPYGHRPGFDLLTYNLLQVFTWRQLFATLGIIPFIALMAYRNWPYQLRVFFWVIIPIWFIVHLFGSVMAETREVLVPQALIFIPGALLCLDHRNEIGDSIKSSGCINSA
jgi:hypothetical protein